MSRLLQIRTVAAELACSKEQVYVLIRDGKLKGVRVGIRGLRVPRSSLERFLEENAVKPDSMV